MGNDAPKPNELTLSPAIFAALLERKALKEAGASAEAEQVLEDAVRAHWPKSREWHYLCDVCNDTGWQMLTCTISTRCGRQFCAQHDSRYTHSYAQPCSCARGEANRPKQPTAPDPTTAGTVKPRPDRGWRKAHV